MTLQDNNNDQNVVLALKTWADAEIVRSEDKKEEDK